MCDRAKLISDFVDKTIWKDWQRIPIQGDASVRRYWRLRHGTQNVILMDDPPELGGNTMPFAFIATYLQSNGLCAPHLLAHDSDNGLMIISDLGTQDIAAWVRQNPTQEKTLYRTATDVLLRLHSVPPPEHLVRLSPQISADMLDPVGTYYSRSDITDLGNQMRSAFERFAPVCETLALRDFHAENLIWRNRHQGLDQIGLLDFQDAFVAPAGYDLMSLLRDARRDVSPQIIAELIAYFSEKIDAGPMFMTQLACVSVQRNLRILGIFGRLSLTLGKTRYLDLIPRVWNNILIDLADPELHDLRQAVLDILPAPTPTHLAGLKPS
jgi:aminoglycoside/choline kinase family phosphotransferase